MRRATALVGALLACGPASAAAAEPVEALAARVRAREIAFAQTMADRDHSAFATFVAEESLFMGRTVLRGRRPVGRWEHVERTSAAPC